MPETFHEQFPVSVKSISVFITKKVATRGFKRPKTYGPTADPKHLRRTQSPHPRKTSGTESTFLPVILNILREVGWGKLSMNESLVFVFKGIFWYEKGLFISYPHLDSQKVIP